MDYAIEGFLGKLFKGGKSKTNQPLETIAISVYDKSAASMVHKGPYGIKEAIEKKKCALAWMSEELTKPSDINQAWGLLEATMKAGGNGKTVEYPESDIVAIMARQNADDRTLYLIKNGEVIAKAMKYLSMACNSKYVSDQGWICELVRFKEPEPEKK